MPAKFGGGQVVETTVDGGATWQTREFVRPSARANVAIVRLDMLSARRGWALAGDDYDQVMASTSDGGRHWRLQSPPASVQTISLSGAGPTLLWLTTLGPVLSTDAGRRWTVPAAPPGGTYANDSWLAAAPDRLLGFPDDQSLTSIASDNGGLSWTRGRIARIGLNAQVQAGALGPGGVAIAVTGQGGDCGSQGLTPAAAALFTSANGGDS